MFYEVDFLKLLSNLSPEMQREAWSINIWEVGVRPRTFLEHPFTQHSPHSTVLEHLPLEDIHYFFPLLCFTSNLPKIEKYEANPEKPIAPSNYSVPSSCCLLPKVLKPQMEQQLVKKGRLITGCDRSIRSGSRLLPLSTYLGLFQYGFSTAAEASHVSLNEPPFRWTETAWASQRQQASPTWWCCIRMVPRDPIFWLLLHVKRPLSGKARILPACKTSVMLLREPWCLSTKLYLKGKAHQNLLKVDELC